MFICMLNGAQMFVDPRDLFSSALPSSAGSWFSPQMMSQHVLFEPQQQQGRTSSHVRRSPQGANVPNPLEQLLAPR